MTFDELLVDLQNLVAPLVALLKGIGIIFVKVLSWLADLLSGLINP